MLQQSSRPGTGKACPSPVRDKLGGLMHRLIPVIVCCASVAVLAAGRQTPQGKWLVGHRGASAYAPENTIPAFQLAAQQGATFVEFDLQLTKDRQIICLHDNSLERTTDVEAVFPDRARPAEGTAAKRWMIEDFTLTEIKRLDAGAWFDVKFRGTRI